mgnify:FL=1
MMYCNADIFYITMLNKAYHGLLHFPFLGRNYEVYLDGLPVTLMNFLKTLEEHPSETKPKVSVLINCGFIEPEQNDVAVKMLQYFCNKQGYPFGSTLRIGSGEAILNTPLKIFAIRKIKQLAASVAKGKNKKLKATMPLPKKLFIKASTSYWENYGKKNGITPEQMATMDIEKEPI